MKDGVHCSLQSCHQLDFLPFSCTYCSLPYCQHHWRPLQHACSTYDPILADNQIPICPLCALPISCDPSQVDAAMDTHLSYDCPSLPPAAGGRPTPGVKKMAICGAARCSTKLGVPIVCTQCRGEYCAVHRFGRDHACVGVTTGGKLGGTGGGKIGKGEGWKGIVEGVKGMSLGASEVGTKTGTTKSTPARTTSKPILASPPFTAPATAPIKSKPFSMPVVGKVDRRSAAERASAKKALEARAAKGLLSEDEKLKYATLKALESKGKGSGGNDKCVVS